jgi:hypothetical protein
MPTVVTLLQKEHASGVQATWNIDLEATVVDLKNKMLVEGLPPTIGIYSLDASFIN